MAPTLRKLFYLNKAFFTGQAMIFKLLRNGEFYQFQEIREKETVWLCFLAEKLVKTPTATLAL